MVDPKRSPGGALLLYQAPCLLIKNLPPKGRGFRHVKHFEISGPPWYLWNG